MANESQAFTGNVAASSDDPMGIESVLKKGINGLSLEDFMKLSGLTKEMKEIPGVSK
jgi:hypothetical protein